MAFFDSYGYQATKAAFDKGRSTIFDWKKTLREANGQLNALAPKPTTPIKQRIRQTNPRCKVHQTVPPRSSWGWQRHH